MKAGRCLLQMAGRSLRLVVLKSLEIIVLALWSFKMEAHTIAPARSTRGLRDQQLLWKMVAR